MVFLPKAYETGTGSPNLHTLESPVQGSEFLEKGSKAMCESSFLFTVSWMKIAQTK